jgi:serine/threonine-protein kinase
MASIDDRARAFVKEFGGGDCFLIQPISASAGSRAYLAVGRELKLFERFESAYVSKVGAEPQLSLRLITSPQCSALDLIRLGSAEGEELPRIELGNYNIGRGEPLSGTISNLAGRRLVLVLVGDDGIAFRLDAKAVPGRDAATFNVPLTPDASSIGPMQILLAVVSDKPIPSLETFRSGPLSAVTARLVGEAHESAFSVAADFFKFVN